jgi:hypothetical protein
MNLSNPIDIVLFPDAFSAYTPLHPSFVPVHEMGHAFHNRHAGKNGIDQIAPIAGTDFNAATQGCWEPIPGGRVEPILCGQSLPYWMNGNDHLDINVNVTTDPTQYAYYLGNAIYVSGNYADGTDRRAFPNENRSVDPDPSEGFSDTFANFILSRNLFGVGETREAYFQSNVSIWVNSIVNRGI